MNAGVPVQKQNKKVTGWQMTDWSQELMSSCCLGDKKEAINHLKSGVGEENCVTRNRSVSVKAIAKSSVLK